MLAQKYTELMAIFFEELYECFPYFDRRPLLRRTHYGQRSAVCPDFGKVIEVWG